MRNVLREKRGEGYIDIAVGVLCLMLVIALAVSLFPVFMAKQQLDRFADEIVRQVEIVGSTSVTRRIEELREETGLNPEISWDCDYFEGSKIQLNGDISVTMTCRINLGFFQFGSFPVEIRARASGKSEVYYN